MAHYIKVTTVTAGCASSTSLFWVHNDNKYETIASHTLASLGVVDGYGYDLNQVVLEKSNIKSYIKELLSIGEGNLLTYDLLCKCSFVEFSLIELEF